MTSVEVNEAASNAAGRSQRLVLLLRRKLKREHVSHLGAHTGGDGSVMSHHFVSREQAQQLCWLCSTTLGSICVQLENNAAVSTGNDHRRLCPFCFLSAYLYLRGDFGSNSLSSTAETIDVLEKRFDDCAQALMKSAVNQNTAADESEVATFVNSYSLRSFSVLDLHETTSSQDGPSASVLRRQQAAGCSKEKIWHCPACTLVNDVISVRCVACSTKNQEWIRCPFCVFELHPHVFSSQQAAPLCVPPLSVRTSYKPHGVSKAAPPSIIDNGNLFASGRWAPTRNEEQMPHRLWICDNCTLINTRATRRCDVCQALRRIACKKCTYLNCVIPSTNFLRDNEPCTMCGSSLDIPCVDTKLLKTSKSGPNSDPCDELERSEMIAEHQRRLRHRVEKQLDASIKTQRGDGNCLFRGISDELFGGSDLHLIVRHLVTAYMRQWKDDYSMLFETEDAFSAYLAGLEQDGTWGDEMCIHAACSVFQVGITVVSSDEQHWLHNYNPSRSTLPPTDAAIVATKKLPRLFLAYTSPVHFDSIKLCKSATHSESEAAVTLTKLLHELEQALAVENEWNDCDMDTAHHEPLSGTDGGWEMIGTPS